MVVEMKQESPCTVFQLHGELDHLAVPRVRAFIDQAWPSGEPPHLVLDLSDVPFCDSSGLGLLVRTLQRVRQAGGSLVLVVGPGMIERLLTITNLDGHFRTTRSVREALDAAA
ncbi:STAS domain-containing protein [Nonomuraea sp. NPDC050663]|uniref:STAS domain-containing protein n=1 Tax=Nonomuraea sp. NPDC050663 TaxID=3364370 RepID=UPI003793DEDB